MKELKFKEELNKENSKTFNYIVHEVMRFAESRFDYGGKENEVKLDLMINVFLAAIMKLVYDDLPISDREAFLDSLKASILSNMQDCDKRNNLNA